MAIVRVYHRDLAKQLERDRGFIISAEVGGDCRPYEATLAGDVKKLSRREKPYVNIVGRLKNKKETNYYGPSKSY
jgi:hypothetical protein